jgi:hypothetical protein
MTIKEVRELYNQAKEHDYRLVGNHSDLKSYIRTLLDLADQFYWEIKRYLNNQTPHSFYIHEVICACLAFEINQNSNAAMIEYFLNTVHRYLDNSIFDVYWIKNRFSSTHTILGSHLRYRIEDVELTFYGHKAWNKKPILDYDNEKLEKVLDLIDSKSPLRKIIEKQLEDKK